MLFNTNRLKIILKRIRWLLGATRIPKHGPNCRIHPFARFEGNVNNITIGSGVVIDAFANIFCHSNGQIVIGDNAYIGDHAILHTGRKGGVIRLGNDSGVQSFSIVYGHGGCVIGNDVRIAAHCIIIPANHKFSDVDIPFRKQGLDCKGIFIEDDVWLGAGVQVLDGVTIGRKSVIGAGTVVTRSISDGSVAVGVAAKTLHSRLADKNT
jgi:acetyltransferase-like isoleucine patch superfamily enzyme